MKVIFIAFKIQILIYKLCICKWLFKDIDDMIDDMVCSFKSLKIA